VQQRGDLLYPAALRGLSSQDAFVRRSRQLLFQDAMILLNPRSRRGCLGQGIDPARMVAKRVPPAVRRIPSHTSVLSADLRFRP
jgi:hypothetical protein